MSARADLCGGRSAMTVPTATSASAPVHPSTSDPLAYRPRGSYSKTGVMSGLLTIGSGIRQPTHLSVPDNARSRAWWLVRRRLLDVVDDEGPHSCARGLEFEADLLFERFEEGRSLCVRRLARARCRPAAIRQPC
jgi:hypothetical protein